MLFFLSFEWKLSAESRGKGEKLESIIHFQMYVGEREEHKMFLFYSSFLREDEF